MRLYACPLEKRGGALHPCAKAANALDRGGHSYEIRVVRGGSLKPWTWSSRAKDREEVKELSGQKAVPILVLDDGNIVVGSGQIVTWARDHAPARSSS